MLFRLINGLHVAGKGKDREVLTAGVEGEDLLESDEDLCAKFPNKFELVQDHAAAHKARKKKKRPAKKRPAKKKRPRVREEEEAQEVA